MNMSAGRRGDNSWVFLFVMLAIGFGMVILAEVADRMYARQQGADTYITRNIP